LAGRVLSGAIEGARVNSAPPVIQVEGVRKAFGSTVALAGVDLAADAGTVLALLGRNGAGKTTLVRILATLLSPDAGRIRLAGVDVVRDAAVVRCLIGLAGQFAAVDDTLSGRENLELVGRLYGLRRREAQARAYDVLERLGLADAGDQLVRTYSGGMRRRLDLGASLVGRPLVLLLDEPSTGLDPGARIELWGLIDELVGDGTTLLLTTQYLEEADRLADQVAVIDRGHMIAEGSPEALKQRVGGDVLEVRAARSPDLERVAGLLDGLGSGRPVTDVRDQRVTLPTAERVDTLFAATRRIQDAGVAVTDILIRRPSLDDVFLSLTGPDGALPLKNNRARAMPGESPASQTPEVWEAPA
jgi:daunorubicin resistance ABC transporter ATP-binding subunit